MEIQTLISTMNKTEKDIETLIVKNNIRNNAIVVNQYNKDCKEKKKINGIDVKIINKKERGLSKSRNVALENATGVICIVADDDVVYANNYLEIIKKAYLDNENADIIVFKILNSNGEPLKKYWPRKKQINFINSMKISSVEITFKKESIEKANIKFNEKFGSGVEFYSGEENIFLAECLKKGLRIVYIPQFIATIDSKEDSSWFKGYDERYFKTKGACFYKMSNALYLALIMQFAIRKYKIYKKEISLLKSIKYMLQGSKECKKVDF